MAWISWCIVLCSINIVLSNEDILKEKEKSQEGLSNKWEQKIFDELKKRIGRLTLQPNSTNATEIRLYYALYYTELTDEENKLITINRITVDWQDDRLKWNPKDYDGIEETIIHSFQIWTPQIRVQNSLDINSAEYFYGFCNVRYYGFVYCQPGLLHESACSTNLQNWPFDVQTCTHTVAVSSDAQTHLQLKVEAPFVEDYFGAGWTVIEFKGEQFNKTEVIFTYRLKRHAGLVKDIIIFPLVLVSVLILLSLVLSVNGTRWSISCFTLLLNYSLLSQINLFLSKYGENTPLLLLYARGSLLMSFLAVNLTILLDYLKRFQNETPIWINTVNSYVLNSNFKYFIWPRWKMADDSMRISENLTGEKRTEEWLDFANILNSLFIIVFVIVYLCFLFVYIPKTD